MVKSKAICNVFPYPSSSSVFPEIAMLCKNKTKMKENCSALQFSRKSFVYLQRITFFT